MVHVLVTGGAGFVGSNLVRHLLARGYCVTVLERPSADLGSLPQSVPVLTAEVSDVTEVVARIVQQQGLHAIVHLAAIVRARPEGRWIDALLQTNIVLGARLAQAAAENGVGRFVAAGSYWQSQFEPRRYSPVNLYAATKQAFADLLHYYGHSGSLVSVLLKLFGNYGLDDRRENLFLALRRSMNAQEAVAMSSGWQAIDIVHVDDVCSAFLAAIECKKILGHAEFEVGTGTTATIREIAGWFADGAHSDLNINWGALTAPSHNERAASIDDTREQLSWTPKWSIKEGMRALGCYYAEK